MLASRAMFATVATSAMIAACAPPNYQFAPETGGAGGATSSTSTGVLTTSSGASSTSASSSAASSSGAMSTSSTSTSSASSAASSSGVACMEPNKVCSDQCVAQGVANGCADPACNPCPPPPPHGSLSCAGGLCDFYCVPGFNKSNGACQCAVTCPAWQLCDDTGVCKCDNNACNAECLNKGHVLGGTCILGGCVCAP